MSPLWMQYTVTIALLIAGGWIYIMPTLEAYKKGHPQKQAIAVLNALLGWTFIGWVCAMVWAHIKSPQTTN